MFILERHFQSYSGFGPPIVGSVRNVGLSSEMSDMTALNQVQLGELLIQTDRSRGNCECIRIYLIYVSLFII